ncbi:MAG: TolC family protein [Thermoanaerobaculia bacterium]
MTRRRLIIGLLSGALIAPGARAAERLDLQAVVQRALENNPDYLAIAERERELAAQIDAAWADAWPQFSLNGFWNRSRNPSLLNSPDFEDIIEQFPGFRPSVQELNGLNVEVSQLLYTFGKIRSGVELAERAVEAGKAQTQTALLDTALTAAEAYFERLAAQEALITIDAQRRARQESLDVVQARFDLGDATRLELLQAQAALAEVEPAVAAAEGRVAVAESTLESVLDLPSESEVEVVPPTSGLPAVPQMPPLLETALRSRSELADLARQQEALELQKRVVKADGRPQLELTGNYGRTVRELENLDDPLFADWQVNVGLSWSFFDGGRRAGEVAALSSQQRQLALQTKALENRIRLEIEQSWTGYRTERDRLRAAERSAEAAREATRVARESYEEGVSLQADLLAAQERETEAEVARVEAYYGAWRQATRLVRATGMRPDGLGELGNGGTTPPVEE